MGSSSRDKSSSPWNDRLGTIIYRNRQTFEFLIITTNDRRVPLAFFLAILQPAREVPLVWWDFIRKKKKRQTQITIDATSKLKIPIRVTAFFTASSSLLPRWSQTCKHSVKHLLFSTSAVFNINFPSNSLYTLYRQDSIISNANSTYSQATSTRHILADANRGNNSSISLFDNPNPSYMMNVSDQSASNVSLSVNFIPSKFSKFRNRKGGKHDSAPNLPKEGGGLQAFKTNESRMPQGKGRLKWNKFKWVLLVTNSLVCFFLPLSNSFFFSQNHTALDLFPRRSRRLPANMVWRLGTRRCCTCCKQSRTRPFNDCSLRRYPNLSNRLGRYSPQ